MKFFLWILFLLVSVSFAQDTTGVEEGTLVVRLLNLPNNDGVVMVAIANSQENYESDGEPYRGLSQEVVNNQAEVSFEYLPYGEYAIKVFHDEDEDQELDTSFLGIPTEAYGFSNNADGTFGPPAWEDAKFTFSSATDTMSINVD
jgi:uncharacterized protein (DUF2141 family)